MSAIPAVRDTTDFPPVVRARLETLQVNLGYRCNQTCTHCHVNAGPGRKEMMSRNTVDLVLAFLAAGDLATLDLTGGAPELNSHFRYLARSARRLGVKVIDRCNLTILEEPGQDDLARFLADQQIEVTASLPCYLADNVDRQRGKGTFDSSLRGLQTLNRLGYGHPGSGLILNLVYNPQGTELPAPQQPLQAAYKAHLESGYGIIFNELYTLTNMPIQRFAAELKRAGQLNDYLQLLRSHYRPDNLESVMCRNLLSVDWQGYVYDCDFNQMLNLPLGGSEERRTHLADLMASDLTGRVVTVRNHCFGCTAGQGSSCGGSLTA